MGDNVGMKEWAKPVSGRTPRKKVADLIGKVVDIPGSVFGQNTPGLVYKGTVVAPDNSHRDAAIIKLKNDRNRYYFPIGQIREWLGVSEPQPRRDSSLVKSEQHTISEQTDDETADVLAAMQGDAEHAVIIDNQDQDNNEDYDNKEEDMDMDMEQMEDVPMSAPDPMPSQNLNLPNVPSMPNMSIPNVNLQGPPVYTAQATSTAVLAAFELGFRMAYNLCTGVGATPAQMMLQNPNQQ